MIESRRRAYLDAMGLDVWTVKPKPPEPDRLVFQPGVGETLLLCQEPDDTAIRIAGDIVRALEHGIVWAWPDPEGRAESISLEQAISQQLFTRVVVFGDALAQRVFKGNAPQVLGSARILVTQSLDELTVRGSAKQAFWKQLSVASFN
jgi:hypothetical protein